MTKQKPDKVLAAGIVKKTNLKSILINMHRQKITAAIYLYIYEVTFTRLYTVGSNYSTPLSYAVFTPMSIFVNHII